jgi:hypothetical protein
MVNWPTMPHMASWPSWPSNVKESEGFMLMRRLMTFVDLPGHVYQYRLNIGIR